MLQMVIKDVYSKNQCTVHVSASFFAANNVAITMIIYMRLDLVYLFIILVLLVTIIMMMTIYFILKL